MASFSSRQWIAITGSVILFASLFYVNRKAPASAEKGPVAGGHVVNTAEDFARILEEAKKQVPEDVQASIDRIDKELASGNSEYNSAQLLKSIISKYDSVGAIIPGTYYAE